MKIETFERAQELNRNLMDIDNAIERILSKKISCSGEALNISFCDPSEREALEKNVISYLKNKRNKFQKEFDNLK